MLEDIYIHTCTTRLPTVLSIVQNPVQLQCENTSKHVVRAREDTEFVDSTEVEY